MAALLSTVEAAVCVAAVTSNQLTLSGSKGVSPPTMAWGHVAGMVDPLLQALVVWTRERAGAASGEVRIVKVRNSVSLCL